MHTYPGITPLNVWDFDFDIVRMLIDAATARNEGTRG